MHLFKKFLRLILRLLTILFLAMIASFFFQEKIILQARKLDPDYQYQFDQPFKELYFEKSGVKINGLYFKSTASKGLVFYLHGNSGNLQKYGKRAVHFTDKGYDIFMMDYRTFGKSTGEVSEAAIHDDVDWIFNEIRQKYPFDLNNTFIYGRSLGTGIATHLASHYQTKGLLLETPYYNIADVAKCYFPFLPYEKFLRYTFRTDNWLTAVKSPVYIFHGTSDWTVPYRSGIKLKSLFKKGDEFITIKSGGHNNLYTFDLYHDRLNKILNAE